MLHILLRLLLAPDVPKEAISCTLAGRNLRVHHHCIKFDRWHNASKPARQVSKSKKSDSTVDLIQSPAQGLRNTEVHEDHADQQAASIDITDLRLEVGLCCVIQVGHGEDNDKGGEPEEGSTDGHDLLPVLADGEFSGDEPGEGAPCQVEEEDLKKGRKNINVGTQTTKGEETARRE